MLSSGQLLSLQNSHSLFNLNACKDVRDVSLLHLQGGAWAGRLSEHCQGVLELA